jgi:hypothetical protein
MQGGFVAIVGLLFMVMPALAHHSATAEFDVYKTASVTGTISRVDWINPHTYIYVDVKDDKGAVTTMSFQTWPTGILHRFGIKRDMFVIGQPIAVEFNPGKDATKNMGFLRHVKFENGDEINFKNNAISDNN